DQTGTDTSDTNGRPSLPSRHRSVLLFRRLSGRLKRGNSVSAIGLRPGIEVGDMIPDVAPMLAIARSPALTAHLFERLLRQADIKRRLGRGEERTALPGFGGMRIRIDHFGTHPQLAFTVGQAAGLNEARGTVEISYAR